MRGCGRRRVRPAPAVAGEGLDVRAEQVDEPRGAHDDGRLVELLHHRDERRELGLGRRACGWRGKEPHSLGGELRRAAAEPMAAVLSWAGGGRAASTSWPSVAEHAVHLGRDPRHDRQPVGQRDRRHLRLRRARRVTGARLKRARGRRGARAQPRPGVRHLVPAFEVRMRGVIGGVRALCRGRSRRPSLRASLAAR